jgi:hypothetical protein
MATVCQSQLLTSFCGLGHYPEAPMCDVYDPERPWFDPTADYGAPNSCGCSMSGGAGGSSGVGGSTGGVSGGSSASGGSVATAGVGGAGGVIAPVAGTSATAGSAAAGTGASSGSKKSGGCSVVEARAHSSLTGLALLVAGASWCVRRSRRRTRARA